MIFPGSSVVEQAAVNRLVAGSNPARGATPTDMDWAFHTSRSLVVFWICASIKKHRIKPPANIAAYFALNIDQTLQQLGE